MWGINAQADLAQGIGARTVDEWLQGQIGDKKREDERDRHGNADLSCLFKEKKDDSKNDPEPTGIPEKGDEGKNPIEDGMHKIGIDPIENGKIEGINRIRHKYQVSGMSARSPCVKSVIFGGGEVNFLNWVIGKVRTA